MNIPYEVEFILNKLENENFKAYICGGACRDLLLNKTPKDWDITTNALPDEIKKVFKDYKIIETGLKHGTVTLVSNNNPYEITTFRIDGEYSDNRRPETVQFVNDLFLDLSRRDFTMNALAHNPKEGLFDYFNGEEDLKNKIIKAVGNPVLRFEEDSLRILRAIRFSSVLGFLIEEETNEAIFKYCFLLQNISKERIQSELNKILLSDFGADNITYYRFVFEEIFPNIILTPNYLKNTEDTNFLGKSLSEQLSLLLCENSIKKVEKFLKSLKYDNKTINEVIQILSCDYFLKNNIIENNYAFNKRIKYAIKTYGKRNVFNCLCYLWKKTGINLLDYYSEISGYNQCCTIKQLPINGDSLIELGYKGKEIGKILNDILDLIIEEKISNDVVMILDYIKKTYK